MLTHRLAAGSHEAFDAIVQQHHAQLVHLATRLMAWDPTLAEDAVQDVWASLWHRRRRFRGKHGTASLVHFLNVSTANRCRSLSRSQSARARREARRAHPPHAPTQYRPDDATRQQETAHAIRKALLNLRPADRQVIVLYHLQAWSIEAVAESLKVSPNACKTRLSRARTKLKALLPKHLQKDLP